MKTPCYPQDWGKTGTCPCWPEKPKALFTQAFQGGKLLIWMEKQGFSTQKAALYYCY